MKNGILFDLDGTLWDSSQSVTESYNLALERLGYTLRMTQADIMGAMGKTMYEIAHIFFDYIDPERAESIMDYCTEVENEYIKTHGGYIYEGVKETLEALKAQGWFIACVSNCQSGYIEDFLEYSGYGCLFDDIECWGNTLKLKAYNISLVAKRNGLDRVVYVGDTMGDYNSAMEAGAEFIHAAYGFGNVPEGTPKADSIIDIISQNMLQ